MMQPEDWLGGVLPSPDRKGDLGDWCVWICVMMLAVVLLSLIMILISIGVVNDRV